jgi:hypothetical protein
MTIRSRHSGPGLLKPSRRRCRKFRKSLPSPAMRFLKKRKKRKSKK